MTSRILPATAVALAALAATATASAAELRGALPDPGVRLPAAAGAASGGPGWIVGARPGASAAAVARDHGARRLTDGAWLVSRGRARELARALRARRLLTYAEPDGVRRRAQAPVPDPLSPQSAWRNRVVGAAVPPVTGPASPLIALVDSQLDVSHPEFATGNVTTAGGAALTDFHGTATAAVAAAAANGVGNLGVWPGARALNLPLPAQIRCSDSARTIAAAIRARAAVINMSYGSPNFCEAEAEALQQAVRAGIVPVAASGNESEQGNPKEYPATLPHVVTVGALADSDRPAFFSNESPALDLSAPGVNVLTAVPARSGDDFDADGTVDGYAAVSGTSFAAPMVSAAVAWVRAARPTLTAQQAADVVRLGARDIGDAGYEDATGYGILSLPAALAKTAPPADPAEPNDEFRYVDGRTFGRAAPPVYGGRTTVVTATADFWEDPADLYRVKLRKGERVRVKLKPRIGDPDLYVYSGSATLLRQRGRVIARSVRGAGRTDAVSLRNRGRGTTTLYVAVGFTSGKKLELLNAAYTLRIARR